MPYTDRLQLLKRLSQEAVEESRGPTPTKPADPLVRDVICPGCGATFTRRASDPKWAGGGGQGFYYTQSDHCFECRTGWVWDGENPAGFLGE